MRLRQTNQKCWLGIIHTKADLLTAADVERVERRFDPTGAALLARELKRFKMTDHGDRFQVDSMLVSTWNEDFKWNGETTPSARFSDPHRHGLLSNCLRRLYDLDKKVHT